MDQQQNPSAGLFSTRYGDNESFHFKPIADENQTPAAKGEESWEGLYTPNEPEDEEDAPKNRSRRSRLVVREHLPAEAAEATPISAPPRVEEQRVEEQRVDEAPPRAAVAAEPTRAAFEPVQPQPDASSAIERNDQPGPAVAPQPDATPRPPENASVQPVWMPVTPVQAPPSFAEGWPQLGTQPVFIPVYFAPYPPPGEGTQQPAAYMYPYISGAYGAVPSGGPGPGPAPYAAMPPSWEQAKPACPANPTESAVPPQPHADVPVPAEEEEWQPDASEAADAVPTEEMASPVPVPLSKLDFSEPTKRRVWPWVIVVFVVLVAAAFGLWKSGLYQKLPIPNLRGILATKAPVEPESTVKPMVSAFTVEESRALAPATLQFSVATNLQVKQIRLMDATGLPLSAQITSENVEDGQSWSCQVSFPAAYQGEVSLSVCGEDGVWVKHSQSVSVEVE